MQHRPSRYLVMSDEVYRRPDGRLVRLGYLSRRARLVSLNLATADCLRTGEISRLPDVMLRRLTDLGALTDRPDNELDEVLTDFRNGSAALEHRRFTVMPTAYCNMGCSYCGQVHLKSHLAGDRAARLLARIEDVIADPSTKRVSVTWFGGEPMLAYRFVVEMSERLVAAAAASGVVYNARMATNGSLINVRKLVELYDVCLLRDVDITVDGPRQIHDRRRVLKSGGKSFDKCLGVLTEVADAGLVPDLRFNLRVNVDAENEEYVPTLLEDLASARLNIPRFSLQFMPVHSWGNDVSDVELEARQYARREAAWLRAGAALGFTVATLPTQVKPTTCQATSRSGEIHDPRGQVYACSEHPLVPQADAAGVVATLADLTGSLPRPAGQFDDWYDQVSTAEQPCNGCPFLPVCGGCCPKLWREGHLPCPSYKFNTQDRFDLAASRLGLTVAANPGTVGA